MISEDTCGYENQIKLVLDMVANVNTTVTSKNNSMEEDHPPVMRRIFAALFFGVSSFVIVVANKIVLTSYKYVCHK